MRVAFTPATPEDFAALIRSQPVARVRAIAARLEGELLGVGGFLYQRDGTVWASMAIAPRGRGFPAAIWRAGVMGMRMAERLGLREVLAVADKDQPAAGRYLERLGFTRIGEHKGEPLYRWRRGG